MTVKRSSQEGGEVLCLKGIIEYLVMLVLLILLLDLKPKGKD